MKRKIIDFFLPSSIKGDDRLRPRFEGVVTTLLLISVVAALAMPPVVLLFADAGPMIIVAAAVCITSPLIGVCIIRVTGNLLYALVFVNLLGVTAVSFIAFHTGGLASVMVPWLLANLAMLAAFGDPRIITATAAATLVSIVYMFAAEYFGFLPTNAVAESFRPHAALVSYLGAVSMLGVGAVSVIKRRKAFINSLRAATAGARENEARLLDIAESSSDWFWDVDAFFRFQRVSQRYCKLMNISPDLISGRTRDELFQLKTAHFAENAIHLKTSRLVTDLDTEEAQGRQFDELLSKREPFRDFVWASYGFDGRPMVHCYSGIPMFGETGEFLGFRGTGTDVTELKTAEAELRWLATKDSLTGIFNRRHFEQLTETEILRAQRLRRPLSLLVLDADHFKSINDTYGHDIGDLVLIELAKVCQVQLRNFDVFCRFGGEEFAVTLPETDGEVAMGVAERLRSTLEAASVLTDQGTVKITVSIGIASLTEEINDFGRLMKVADRAMYHAKRMGRNRVAAPTLDEMNQPTFSF